MWHAEGSEVVPSPREERETVKGNACEGEFSDGSGRDEPLGIV